MSPASIEHLSSDDLLHIFHLCGLHEWVRIEKTSHQWRLLILHEWRQLKRAKLSDLMGLKKESSCEGPFPRHFVRPPLIRYLGLRCGANLKEIYAGDCRLHMEQSCLPVLSQEFPHLRKIDLSNTVFIPSESEFEGSFAPFLQAEHVSLNSCVDDSCSCYYSPDEIDSTLHMILAAVPNVSLVYMSHNTALSGAALFALPSETLTVLDLGFCRRVTDDILSSVFSPLINLTSISLYSNHKITGSCLTHLSEIIRCVDLSYCDSITSENLQNFLQFHHCIDTLKIAHVNSMNNQLLSKLSELPQLKSLTFNSYFRFIFYESQRHPIDIYAGICGLGNLTTLEYLDLSRNEFVDDDSLKQICYCRALRNLNISNLQLVTAAGFAHLTNLTCLESLDVSLNDQITVDILLAVAHRNSKLTLITAHHCAKVKLPDIERVGPLWPDVPTVFQLY